MSSQYRPYYGTKKRRRRRTSQKNSGISTKLLVCLFILFAAVAVRFLFPEFTGKIYDKLFQQADYSAAFSSIGAGLNGDISMKDALKDAYGYAFAGKSAQQEADADSSGGEDERPLQITEVFNGSVQEAAEAFAASQQEYSDLDIPEDAQTEVVSLPYTDMVLPVSGTVLSGYGYRLDPNENSVKYHYGVDIAVQEGETVSAFTDGIVTVVGTSTSMGNYVIIKHQNGETQYAHLNEVAVESGQSVQAGQSIGTSGSTGLTQQPCLHFELKFNGKYVNPEYYLTWQ